jgi:hypothetical protein
MQIINQDEEGQKLYLNFGRDISSYTALTIEFEPKVGDKITSLMPTLETSDTWVGDQQMLANEFVSYAVTTDMFSRYTGIWRMKATATVGGVIYSTQNVEFQVTE